MNEVLIKRLVGACALVGVTVVLANLLPEPSALPPPEPAAKRVTYDLKPLPEVISANTQVPAPATVQEPLKPAIESAQPSRAATESAQPEPSSKPAAPQPKPAAPTPKPATAPKAAAVPKPAAASVKPATPPQPKLTAAKPSPKSEPPKAEPSTTEVAAVEPAVAPKAADPESKPAAPRETWFVQIGAFAKETNAQQAMAKLRKAGMKALQDTLEWKSGARYRVRCGPFASKEEAEAERARATGLGFGDARLAHEPVS